MSRLYTEAAAVLAPSLLQDGKRRPTSSIKSRTFSDAVSNKKMTHLLVCETLKYSRLLDKTLELAGINAPKELSDNMALLYVLLYEFLIGKQQKIRGGGALKRAILEKETRLRKGLETARMRFPDLVPPENNDNQESQQVPRFARINTLKTTRDEVWKSLEALATKEDKGVLTMDEHIPNLVRFPPGTDLHDHPLVKQGKLILQDKSSCFPVAALAMEMHRRGLGEYDAIDCCAAPGNKTTQLAAELTGSTSRLFAFDKSSKRYELLRSRVEQAGAQSRVECIHGDFLLESDPCNGKFQRVRTILLDPSCSGSGSFSLDRLLEDRLKETDERVLKLAEFQLEALSHAMSFPQAELISYSTCSVLYPENEGVVFKALERFPQDWELVPALPEWKRRGESRAGGLTESQARMVARADFALGDATGGFFVALFARRKQQTSGGGQKQGTETVTTKKNTTATKYQRDVSWKLLGNGRLRKLAKPRFVSRDVAAAHRVIVDHYKRLRTAAAGDE